MSWGEDGVMSSRETRRMNVTELQISALNVPCDKVLSIKTNGLLYIVAFDVYTQKIFCESRDKRERLDSLWRCWEIELTRLVWCSLIVYSKSIARSSASSVYASCNCICGITDQLRNTSRDLSSYILYIMNIYAIIGDSIEYTLVVCSSLH